MPEQPPAGRAGRVVVVGSLNTDLTVTTARHPHPGETLLADAVRRSGGGKGANQAVAAARAGGAATAMVGAVGTDAEGDALAAALERDGVDTTALARLDGEPSGLAVITVDAGGENTILVVAGANAALTVDDAACAVVATADVVLAQLEVPQDVVAGAAAARRPGALLVLNAAPSAPLVPALAEQVDLLIVNEHEAADLAGGADRSLDDLVGTLLETVPAVLVTLGAAGSRLQRRCGEPLVVPAPVVRAVDAVGAGDTYCGVLCAALAAGLDDATAMRRASAAAALAVQRPGAQDAVPTTAEVEAALADADR
ncbi:PfkB family carbohydrate kinase [Lapillicoccus jejuensis]|uniref:Ribokinase n=1 Tax=Lapillicoccus jejuensis TaxID=402171 RepID=A0A542E6W6_9MICO|nr:PfkB family carbohydrate kinase [Lapillicoccus jejuensis]TQJ11067.1 ribokinase [Lapillicoccus jejuensis]